MRRVPFTKLHAAENDFLLTPREDVPPVDLVDVARRICARTTGIGADGWMVLEVHQDCLRTELYNSDGSKAEISGNGTRCAAAWALFNDVLAPPVLTVTTAAGPKQLRLIQRRELFFEFEMNMGEPKLEELRLSILLAGRTFDATTLNVGNPQCVLFVDELPEDWRVSAAEAEGHPRFANRSNVSLVKVVDRHTLDVVFYERGAGETRSSGTGSTGAAVAAILRQEVESPVEIRTPAGSLNLRWDASVFLTGPAEVIGEGSIFLDL